MCVFEYVYLKYKEGYMYIPNFSTGITFGEKDCRHWRGKRNSPFLFKCFNIEVWILTAEALLLQSNNILKSENTTPQRSQEHSSTQSSTWGAHEHRAAGAPRAHGFRAWSRNHSLRVPSGVTAASPGAWASPAASLVSALEPAPASRNLSSSILCLGAHALCLHWLPDPQPISVSIRGLHLGVPLTASSVSLS